MALTEFYVDFASGNDSTGDGTSPATAYKTIEKLLSTDVHPANDGARINVQATTDDPIAAELDLTTTYSFTNTIDEESQLVIQGYTATSGDGGIGGLDGGGSISILSDSAQDFVWFVDMHLHNTGSAIIVDLDNACGYINCEFDNSSAANTLGFDTGNMIGCYIHNLSHANSITFSGAVFIYRNRFIDTDQNFGANWLRITATQSVFTENIIWLDNVGANGLEIGGSGRVIGNSIFQNTIGTQAGIRARSATDGSIIVLNNLVEGFSGTGGVGIDMSDSTDMQGWRNGNAVFNCTTAYNNGGGYIVTRDADDNETLSASPFVNAGAKDFSPVDTGNVKEGSLPDKIGLFT